MGRQPQEDADPRSSGFKPAGRPFQAPGQWATHDLSIEDDAAVGCTRTLLIPEGTVHGREHSDQRGPGALHQCSSSRMVLPEHVARLDRRISG